MFLKHNEPYINEMLSLILICRDEAHIDLEKALTKDPGNDEAAMAYTMIEPIKQTLFELESLMKYRNYQPVVDKITEIIEQVS